LKQILNNFCPKGIKQRHLSASKGMASGQKFNKIKPKIKQIKRDDY